MANELSVEKAIDVLYTIRAYYASLTAGYPKGKDCRGIGDVMCSEIANSCLMAIKALEQQRWIPVTERLPEESGEYLVYCEILFVPDHVDEPNSRKGIKTAYYYRKFNEWFGENKVYAWMPLPSRYQGE